MKFSVVTISFNQAKFLERALRSVLEQQGVDVEYIIVDPGSTDGSREIIKRYRDRLDHVILEKDHGAADGLNRGFARATGDVYCYLNSDDEYRPDAFSVVRSYFANHPEIDVICGHAYVVDSAGHVLRRIWSDPFQRLSQAYGGSIQIQPSTFIRASSFKGTGGFNAENKITWDGELLIDLALSGARIGIIEAFLSNFRVHSLSITGSGRLDELMGSDFLVRFEKLMGRSWRYYDPLVEKYWFMVRQFRNPRAMIERLRYGPVYRRCSDSWSEPDMLPSLARRSAIRRRAPVGRPR
jgi:glycosyltransferase involved in cell wall biosynthesis